MHAASAMVGPSTASVSGSVAVAIAGDDEDKVSKEIMSILKLLSASSEVEYGTSLLHTLFLDMLHRESFAGQMLSKFIQAEFIKEKWVDVKLQYMAIGIIVVLNLGALYYVALKGMSRGSNWQWQFLYACILNWLSDVFFIQVVDFVWCEFLLAATIRRQVMEATKEIIGLCDAWLEMLVQSPSIEDAGLVSTRLHMCSHVLASYRPHVLESQLALRYSPTSKVSSAVRREEGRWWRWLAQVPLEIHRTISSMIASTSLALMIFLWYQLEISLLWIVLPLMCILAVVIVYRTLHHKDILYITKAPSISAPHSFLQIDPLDKFKHNDNNHIEIVSINGGEKLQSGAAISNKIEISSPNVKENVKEERQLRDQLESDRDSSNPVVELSIPDGSDEYSELSDDLLASYKFLDHESHETKAESISAAISKSLSLSQSFPSFSDLDASYHSRSSSSASSDSSSFASIN